MRPREILRFNMTFSRICPRNKQKLCLPPFVISSSASRAHLLKRRILGDCTTSWQKYCLFWTIGVKKSKEKTHNNTESGIFNFLCVFPLLFLDIKRVKCSTIRVFNGKKIREILKSSYVLNHNKNCQISSIICIPCLFGILNKKYIEYVEILQWEY